MSAKVKDDKNRWRSKLVNFRASPEEAYQIDMLAKTSGLTKQEFLINRLLSKDITVKPNIRVQKFIIEYLNALTAELKRLEKVGQTDDVLDNIGYLLRLIDKMSPTN